MQILTYDIGFIDIPGLITLNIYTIGCKHKCKDCHSKNLQDFDYPYKKILSKELFFSILNKSISLIDGVCWLGGDPLEQQDLLYKYSLIINDRKLKNILYTGYFFEEIDFKIKEVVDIIVDGKFNGFPINHKKTNQKIWLKKDNIFSIFNYNSIKKEFIC